MYFLNLVSDFSSIYYAANYWYFYDYILIFVFFKCHHILSKSVLGNVANRVLVYEAFAHFGVTVNAIAPGPMDTKLISKVPSENIDSIVDQQLIRKKGTPEDAWNVASFLLSDAGSMVTGDILHIGGA